MSPPFEQFVNILIQARSLSSSMTNVTYLHVISRTAFFFYKLQKCQKLYIHDKQFHYINVLIIKLSRPIYSRYINFKNQPFEWFI